ncbi:MAG TPA: DUF2087 domain-containing protein [Acidimicrobiia bacterium]|nr:DUF2087 domain-containing protein [Acidimicrobiia bacterium]
MDPHDETPFLDAGELVGMLADDDRRLVLAALVLGATDEADVRRTTGLEPRRSVRALQRLVDAGLVTRGDDGTLHLLTEAFRLAARAAAAARPAADEHGDAPAEVAKVMRAFVRDGRLLSIPAVHSKRLVILDWLAQQFEPGRKYSESMVNLVLGRYHADTAALRRYLVDEGYLDRDRGEYWRSGGTFDPK